MFPCIQQKYGQCQHEDKKLFCLVRTFYILKFGFKIDKKNIESFIFRN